MRQPYSRARGRLKVNAGTHEASSLHSEHHGLQLGTKFGTPPLKGLAYDTSIIRFDAGFKKAVPDKQRLSQAT